MRHRLPWFIHLRLSIIKLPIYLSVCILPVVISQHSCESTYLSTFYLGLPMPRPPTFSLIYLHANIPTCLYSTLVYLLLMQSFYLCLPASSVHRCGVYERLPRRAQTTGGFCVTRSNPTHQLTDPTQPGLCLTSGRIWTRPDPIQLTNFTAWCN